MKLWQRIVLGVLAVVLILVGGAIGLFKANNTPPQLAEPNYFEYYLNQDTKPVGRVGLFITHLVMPETYREEDYKNLALKPKQYIPWPIRLTVDNDGGTVLLDFNRFYEFEDFEPQKLVDNTGSEKDRAGISYMEHYKAGRVEWVPPRPNFHLDYGYFLFPDQKAGMPKIASKLTTKAQVYYHTAGKGFSNGRVPHEAGTRAIVHGAMKNIEAKYGPLPWKWVTAENFTFARQAMFELLDQGIDTLILGAPRPIYSHHEEFNGGIRHAMHYVHEWQEARNNHKEIKLIIIPELSFFEPIYEAHMAMLRDRLNTLPKEASVKVVMSVHGMAWELAPLEGWIQLAPRYVTRMMKEANNLVDSYGFKRVEVVQSQDHFADKFNDPEGKYLSTNKAFWDGIEANYDYVVNVPMEFFSENTDTLLSHAMFNYEFFDDYSRYDPIEYDDWSVPYTQTFVQDGTTIIYNGVPVGAYNKPIIEAFTMALDSVLSQSDELSARLN